MRWWTALSYRKGRAADLRYSPPHEGEVSVASRVATLTIIAVYIFSTPPKWSTLYVSCALIVLALLAAHRAFWRSQGPRVYALATLPWLLPVIGSAVLQNIQGLPTATPWSEQIILALRVLGVGFGFLLLLHKQYLTLRQLGLIVLACLLVNALIGIGQWLSQPHSDLAAWRSFRATGLAGNPNPYGFFMALGLVLSSAWLLNYRQARSLRLALWISATIFLLGIVSSGSRGAIIIAVAGIAVLVPPNTWRRFGIYTALITSLAIAYFVSDWHAADTLSDDLRIAALKFSLEAIAQRPLSGWGIESFPHIPGHTGVNAPHNMLADLALSGGVIALGAFLLSTAWVCHQLRCVNTPLANTLLALLVSAFIAGTLEYSVLSSIHFRGPWLLIIMLASHAIGNAGCGGDRGSAVAHPCRGAHAS